MAHLVLLSGMSLLFQLLAAEVVRTHKEMYWCDFVFHYLEVGLQ